MFTKQKLIRLTLITCMLGILTLNALFAQFPVKGFSHKKAAEDSVMVYKSAVFLLLKDSTFLDFGIQKNKEQLDYYVWYKSGKQKSAVTKP